MSASTLAASAHQPLPSPAELKHQMPLSDTQTHSVREQRDAIRRILGGDDERLLVVVGPCSVHDPVAVLDYAKRLATLASAVSEQMLLVMRVYVEKPRTTTGWKGLAYDPNLDGGHDMAEGLKQTRELMVDIASLGLAVATELLNPVIVQYIDDVVAWGAIGARTTESQVHRELVSGLDFPVGFKNTTSGSVQVACDAMNSAAHPHYSFGVDAHGQLAAVQTQGNADTHLILRGGASGPNFDAASVADALHALNRSHVSSTIMVDCSHANSAKDPARQPEVLASVIAQRLRGCAALRGVMLESFIERGKQPLKAPLCYGQSVTDGCLGWADTERVLYQTANALAASNIELAL